ncbi:hypothetical protein D3C86_2168990 [compost metagenome]
MERIIRITTSNIRAEAPGDCDIFLQPEDINQFKTFDTSKVDQIYQFGYNYAKEFEKEFVDLQKEVD